MKYENAQVRALVRVFRGGRMIGPGEKAGDTFTFTGDELPAGCQLADEEVKPASKAKPGDTKPEDAQAAVKAKAKGFNEA